MTYELNLENLRPYLELTDTHKHQCRELYYTPIKDKELEYKYVKRTDDILKRTDTIGRGQACDCFLTFDAISLTSNYTALVFSLCGISHPLHLVIYASAVENGRVADIAEFLTDILVNLVRHELPRLPMFPVTFLLLHNNVISHNVRRTISLKPKYSKIFKKYLFVLDATFWRYYNMHIPYIQNAWLDIMHTEITKDNIPDIFSQHAAMAKIKHLGFMEEFVRSYLGLAKMLLASKSTVMLRHCTLERVDDFVKIIRANMKIFKSETVTRQQVFQLLRAVIIIYDH
ncbi:uncharacterized protein LOC117589173 [Drosophila guanche]|uniref:Uncharacterized protein n=1 Tax=Drosophila guanche TaxID=7266 RepID=A0A3B0JYP1_DROGU|nr:uncharacterized protein LOC117589173 [Drosophila guanche]SPP87197.1 Hypothetical predicted protein [Drosophila guanche]